MNYNQELISLFNILFKKHRAWWAIKMLNCDLTEASEESRLQLCELE